MDQAVHVLVQHAQLEYYTNVGDFSDGLRFRLDKPVYTLINDPHGPIAYNPDTISSAIFNFKKKEIKSFDHKFVIPHNLLWSVGQTNYEIIYPIAGIVSEGIDWSMLGLSAESVYDAVARILLLQKHKIAGGALPKQSGSVYGIEPEGVRELPAMGMVAHCPGCEDSSPLSFRATLKKVVMHLNDYHRWSREDIADWMDIWADSNDVDISF